MTLSATVTATDIDPASDPAPTARARTARARLVLAIIGGLSLVLGAFGLAVGLNGLRAACLITFCLLGVGTAPWQLNAWLRLPGRLTFGVLTGVATLTLGTSFMAITGAWMPGLLMIVAVLISIPLHAIGAVRAYADRRAEPGPPVDDRHIPRHRLHAARTPWYIKSAQALTAGAGALLCLISALSHQHLEPEFGGFPTQIGPWWLLGLFMILCSLALIRNSDEWQLAFAVTALMLVLTLSSGIVYDWPRSQSAAKHVDLLQQIRTLHQLDSSVAIYNSWPGFFAFTAWLSDIAGINDPMPLVRFWPALLGLFRLVTLRYFFGKIFTGTYQAWIATALAIVADPQGADYFSPQSVGFVIGIAVFGLALSTRQTAAKFALMLIAGAALAVTHQLSPFIVGGVLVVLVAFRRVRPWWSPVLVLGPAVLWTGAHFSDVSGYLSLRSVGEADNFLPPSTAVTSGLQRLPIVGLTVYSLAVAMLILGALAAVALLRHWRDSRFWAMACAPGVGFVLVLINPYGQEGIFRAVLFAVPWLAALAAHLFQPSSWVFGRLPAFAVLTMLSGLFLIAGFGMDGVSVIRTGDLAALSYYDSQASSLPNTEHEYMLLLGAGNLPNSPAANSDRNLIVSRDKIDVPVVQEVNSNADAQVAKLTAALQRYALQNARKVALYALWSPTSSDYAKAYGLQRPEQFAELRDAFIRSSYWSPVMQQDGTVVFRFDAKAFDATHA